MRLAFNDDQQMFNAALDQMLGAEATGFRTVADWGRWEYGAALDATLSENGFFDAAREETLGPVAAAELVMRIAARPVVVECAASALLVPLMGIDLPRPCAVIDGDADVVRFAPQARSVIWLGDRSRAALLPQSAVTPGETIFAFPVGAIDTGALDWRDLAPAPAKVRARWQVALAAELVGALTGGLDSVLTHVRDRHQFGRPLGSFQAVQHRLAADAVQLDSARWLVLRAAQTGGTGDAALALGHGQNAALRMIYDLHQFMGAMGLTLEHPLHRFTYRAKMLRAALGGPSVALRAFADDRWGVS